MDKQLLQKLPSFIPCLFFSSTRRNSSCVGMKSLWLLNMKILTALQILCRKGEWQQGFSVVLSDETLFECCREKAYVRMILPILDMFSDKKFCNFNTNRTHVILLNNSLQKKIRVAELKYMQLNIYKIMYMYVHTS